MPKGFRSEIYGVRICLVDGCNKVHKGHGLCGLHLVRLRRHGSTAKPTKYPTRALQLWSKVAITANPERCWEWQRARDKRGYGRIGFDGNTFLAHRVAFLMSGGVLTTENNCVLHSCDNPPCCNPAHLSAGSYQENNRQLWARNAHKRENFAKLIEFQNEVHTVAEWSRLLALNYGALVSRLNVGWSVEKALTTPVIIGRNQYDRTTTND